MDVRDKGVFVTGGAMGIGRALTEGLLDRGARVRTRDERTGGWVGGWEDGRVGGWMDCRETQGGVRGGRRYGHQAVPSLKVCWTEGPG